MSEAKFRALLGRQLNDAEKRAQAHYLVITDRGLDHAHEQVKMILADIRTRLDA
jgi:dephospho-CoA kinase